MNFDFSVFLVILSILKNFEKYSRHLQKRFFLSEAEKQMEMAGEYPDVVIGCFGGGSNFGGISFPFMRHNFTGERNTRFIAAEPAACPKLTKGKFDYGDEAGSSKTILFDLSGHGLIDMAAYDQFLAGNMK